MDKISLEQKVKAAKGGANWFYWIAGLSVINSIAVLCNVHWNFVIGLGFTQIFDAVALMIVEDLQGNAVIAVKLVALMFSVCVAAMFALFGWFAHKQKRWAFVVGMILYLLDGVLFLVAQDWFSVGFHAFALFGIFSGYSCLKSLQTEVQEQLDAVEQLPEDTESSQEMPTEPAAG